MSQYEDEMWEAAEFLGEWDHNGLRYKALEVPRNVIDEGSNDEFGALWIVGIDINSNVREYECFFDPCNSRMGKQDWDEIKAIREHTTVCEVWNLIDSFTDFF